MHFKSRLIAAGVAVACMTSTDRVRAADSGPVLSLSAVAVLPEDPGVPGRTKVGPVTIIIDRWSTEPDPQQLTNTSPESVLAALRPAPPVGVIRRGSITIASLLYAREVVDDETKARRVLIATDRPLTSWDLATEPGALPPGLTLFDIQLSKYGKGQGRLVAPHGTDPMAPAAGPICFAAVSTDLENLARP